MKQLLSLAVASLVALALAVLVMGPALALAAPVAPAAAPHPCDTQACIYAPRAVIEELVRQAYEAGRAEGLQGCRVKSGSWT